MTLLAASSANMVRLECLTQVYHGILHGDKDVEVLKMQSGDSLASPSQFLQAIELMHEASLHPNIVHFHGACLTIPHRMLVLVSLRCCLLGSTWLLPWHGKRRNPI